MMGLAEKMSWVKLSGKCFNLVSQINETLHYFRSTSPVLFLEVMLSDSLLHIVWCHGEKRFITIHGLRNLNALMCPVMMFHDVPFFIFYLKLIFITAQVLIWCWILVGIFWGLWFVWGFCLFRKQ